MNVVSPRAAALRILAQRAAAPVVVSTNYSLAEYQVEAVSIAAEILRKRGGVIIADGVGLGKTYIAAALIEQHPGEQIVVAIPSALRKNWQRALSPLGELRTLRVITHGQLSRGGVVEGASLVVVDEAHAFRNPQTRRYRALRLLCRRARVVLLTATPVNNSLADLYYQLRIFARDDAFRDIGIGSLAVLLRPDEIDSQALGRLRSAILIRRSRDELRTRFPFLSFPDGSPLRFPQSVDVRNVAYPPGVPAADLHRFIDQVTFAIYSEEAPRLLLALSLLKRIQSSHAAALISVDRLIGFHHRFLAALADGHWLRPRNSIRTDSEQLSFSALIAEEAPPSIDLKVVERLVAADLVTLIDFRKRIAQSADLKLPRLMDLLAARAPPARTLVFTEFTDTAMQLWREAAKHWQAGLITGKTAYLGPSPASRWEVIKRFAPAANGVPSPKPSEAVYVLIATDVLAEGLNLQDADAVVSYDLPWNPVRLIQRAGRIDRIGSPHDTVVVHNFIPDRDFDDFLGLVRRLREKLASIRSAVGQHGAVLEPEPVDIRFLEDLSYGRAVLLNGVLSRSDHRSENLQEAGPVGCVASLSACARRVLVVLENQKGTRELMVEGAHVSDESMVVEAVISKALELPVRVQMPMDAAEAIARACDFVARDNLVGLGSGESIALCRAIQVAVGRLGLSATPAVIGAADALITEAGGFVGDLRRLLVDIRKAQTATDLQQTLEKGRAECRDSVETTSSWTLVAALACD